MGTSSAENLAPSITIQLPVEQESHMLNQKRMYFFLDFGMINEYTTLKLRIVQEIFIYLLFIQSFDYSRQ